MACWASFAETEAPKECHSSHGGQREEMGPAVAMSTRTQLSPSRCMLLSHSQLLHAIRGLLYAGEYSIIGAVYIMLFTYSVLCSMYVPAYLVVCCMGYNIMALTSA